MQEWNWSLGLLTLPSHVVQAFCPVTLEESSQLPGAAVVSLRFWVTASMFDDPPRSRISETARLKKLLCQGKQGQKTALPSRVGRVGCPQRLLWPKGLCSGHILQGSPIMHPERGVDPLFQLCPVSIQDLKVADPSI